MHITKYIVQYVSDALNLTHFPGKYNELLPFTSAFLLHPLTIPHKKGRKDVKTAQGSDSAAIDQEEGSDLNELKDDVGTGGLETNGEATAVDKNALVCAFAHP